MSLKNLKLSVFVFLFFLLIFNACRDESLNLEANAKLSFSVDTLFFDTVFTKTSQFRPFSYNQRFLVHNNTGQAIEFGASLPSGDKSFFKINIDGKISPNIENVFLEDNDSAWVFVELYADKNNDPNFNPLIIEDSIRFTINGNNQYIQLRAWGRDGLYFLSDSITQDTRWFDQNIPHVIINSLWIKPGATLTIEEGVQLYHSARSIILVDGQLDVKGSAENPVVFQGDRLESFNQEKPGQWGGIYIRRTTQGNSIENVIIKNGSFGIYVDSSETLDKEYLNLKNAQIRNMAIDGLHGRATNMTIENVAINNCARYVFLLSYGGRYELRHCTFNGYSKDFGNAESAVVVSNILRDARSRSELASYPLSFNIRNSIITGSGANEYFYDLKKSKIIGDAAIRNSLVKATSDSVINVLSSQGLDNLINPRIVFIDNFENMNLDSASEAKDFCPELMPPVTEDVLGKMRVGKPDAGAYESNF